MDPMGRRNYRILLLNLLGSNLRKFWDLDIEVVVHIICLDLTLTQKKHTNQTPTNLSFGIRPGMFEHVGLNLLTFFHININQLQVDIPIPWNSEMWTDPEFFGWGPWPLVEPCSWAWTSVLPGMGIRRKNPHALRDQISKREQKNDVRNTWVPGWWFQILIIFTPIIGEDDFHFDDHIFQMCWWKPPTRKRC